MHIAKYSWFNCFLICNQNHLWSKKYLTKYFTIHHISTSRAIIRISRKVNVFLWILILSIFKLGEFHYRGYKCWWFSTLDMECVTDRFSEPCSGTTYRSEAECKMANNHYKYEYKYRVSDYDWHYVSPNGLIDLAV